MKPRRVLLLTNERDFAADEVVALLLESGIDVRRLNIEMAIREPARSWRASSEALDAVVWWRQFQIERHTSDVAEVDDLLVERSQWRAWVSTLNTPDSIWINDLWAARKAENKIEQLRTAKRLGFLLPETLVTNSRVEAIRFELEFGPSVVKTLSSGYFEFSDQSFIFTEPLHEATTWEERAWQASPLIVQERLHNMKDIRVISFSDCVFGAASDADGTVDWRKRQHSAGAWELWPVPDRIATLCSRYRQDMGLRYAAFDFMADNDRVYFLEANQAGEWKFIDRSLDMGIAQRVSDYIGQLTRWQPSRDA